MDTTGAINGYFASDFVQPVGEGKAGRVLIGKDVENTGQLGAPAACTIRDARPLLGVDPLACWRDRAFTCLTQQSNVKTWNEDYLLGMFNPMANNDIKYIYAKELEEVIRNDLLPEYHVVKVDAPGAVLRRGPGSKNNFYGTGVHQDFGMTPEDYKENLSVYDPSGWLAPNWQKDMDKPEVMGFMVINFWRPILMDGPLLSKPLAVMDPKSVDPSDLVFTGLHGEQFHGNKGSFTNQMSLRHNETQKWYYFPKMTTDEVLVFKQFEWWKGESMDRTQLPVRGVFHTAFEDPNTPKETPPRTSSEYRISVFVGKKKTPEEIASSEKFKAKKGDEPCCVVN